jgi:hypothetical protein
VPGRLLQESQGAVHRRQHATAVDVPDDHDRQVHGLRQTHVDEVTLAQVDLCRAPCALRDDDVESC